MTIDPTILKSLGIELDAEAQATFIDHLNDTLQERIGLSLMEELSDEDGALLIELSESGDQEAMTAWLQANIPDYQQIIRDEYDILMGEVAQNATALA